MINDISISLKKSWDEFGFTAKSIITKLPPFVRDKKEVKICKV